MRTGYVPTNEQFDLRLNQSIAALLLVTLMPVFLFIIVLQKVFAPGPVFYRGARLGKDRVPFQIYKFRTLEAQAVKLTTNQTLPRRNLAETRIGGYLRASRLDELPQLLNILRGEMVFMGPRPIRPEMEHVYAAEAPSYMERFRVRPGLVGLAQAIMTHGTPKGVRARFNRMCCRSPLRYPAMFAFVSYVGLCVLRNSAAAVCAAVSDAVRPMGEHKWLSAGFVRPRDSRVEIAYEGRTLIGAVSGICEQYVQFVASEPFPTGKHLFVLTRQRRRGRITRIKVYGEVRMVQPLGIRQCGFIHYATYSAPSRATQYFVERYFLQSSIVPA